jgi:hypothetical protein
MTFDDDGFEIVDTENYRPDNSEDSHKAIILKCISRCNEAGSKEMRAGFMNTKFDKYGNAHKIPVEDTRKIFIESVKTFEMNLYCDFDDDVKDEILNLDNQLDELFKELYKQEKKDWDDADIQVEAYRKSNGIVFKPNRLNEKLPYYQEYIDDEIEIYRDMFKSLCLLGDRLNWYGKVSERL